MKNNRWGRRGAALLLMLAGLVFVAPQTTPPASAACTMYDTLSVRAHVQYKGWMTAGSTSCYGGVVQVGTVGQSLRLEALRVTIGHYTTNTYEQKLIEGSAHVQNIGWVGNTFTGSYEGYEWGRTGQGLRMEAFTADTPTTRNHICYRAHVQNLGWRPWACDGATTGTVGQGLRIEAMQFKIIAA